MFLDSVSWGAAEKCRYRAGYSAGGRMWGIQLSTTTSKDTFTLRPRNSVGPAESCSFEIPAANIPDVAKMLLSAIAEIAPKSEIVPNSIESLIAEQGTWGDHPIHRRGDWIIEVASHSTQRGYWDWVAASIEQNEGESDALLPSTDSLGQSQ